jgi:hypothetical protein
MSIAISPTNTVNGTQSNLLLTCRCDLTRGARPLLQPHPRRNTATLLRSYCCCHRLLRRHLLLLLCGVLRLHLRSSTRVHCTPLTPHGAPCWCCTTTHSLLSHTRLLLRRRRRRRLCSRRCRCSRLLLLLLLCSCLCRRRLCCCLLLPLELCLASHCCLLLFRLLFLLGYLKRAQDAAARLAQGHLSELEV